MSIQMPASYAGQLPALSFVSHPVLDAQGYIDRLIPILQKDGLRVAYLPNDGSSDNLEILRKGRLEEPEQDDVIAVVCDFPYKGSHLSFDYNRPRSILSFLRNYILDHTY